MFYWGRHGAAGPSAREVGVKRITILAITSASALLAPVRAGAEERAFISEDLCVFLHQGPSSQFKIVGTLAAGTPITVTTRNNELAASDQDHQMTWFRNGAVVLGVGLLLGLLIPRLSIPRRRNSGW
jgi:SH3 domain protein